MTEQNKITDTEMLEAITSELNGFDSSSYSDVIIQDGKLYISFIDIIEDLLLKKAAFGSYNVLDFYREVEEALWKRLSDFDTDALEVNHLRDCLTNMALRETDWTETLEMRARHAEDGHVGHV